MGLEHYLFALFVFALALILIILIISGLKKNRSKDDAERAKKEEKLMLLYFEVEDMIEGLKEYVELSREKIDVDIKRIETDMGALSTLKESLFVLKNGTNPELSLVSDNAEEKNIKELDNIKKVSINTEETIELNNEFELGSVEGNRNVEDIARELNRSRSEIELMLRMRRYQARAHHQSQKPVR